MLIKWFQYARKKNDLFFSRLFFDKVDVLLSAGDIYVKLLTHSTKLEQNRACEIIEKFFDVCEELVTLNKTTYATESLSITLKMFNTYLSIQKLILIRNQLQAGNFQDEPTSTLITEYLERLQSLSKRNYICDPGFYFE